MLRLQVREIRAWLSGGNQDLEPLPPESDTQHNLGCDSRGRFRGGVDTVEVVAEDEPVIDTRESQPALSH
jgi:hypothetical protein